jgi:hypothetical protein
MRDILFILLYILVFSLAGADLLGFHITSDGTVYTAPYPGTSQARQ